MGLEAHLRLSGDAMWLGNTETWLKLLKRFDEHEVLRGYNWVSGDIPPDRVPELHYALKGLDLKDEDEMIARDCLLDALQCCYDSHEVMVIQ